MTLGSGVLQLLEVTIQEAGFQVFILLLQSRYLSLLTLHLSAQCSQLSEDLKVSVTSTRAA